MSRDLERVVCGDRSIPWEKAANFFVRVKRASIRKKADLGSPQSQPEGEHMGGYGSNYGKVDPGSLLSEGMRERTRPQAEQPVIHDAEGMGVSPEDLQYARSMERVNEDQELSQIQAENEAAFMEQKLQETSQRAEMAEATAEQAGQQAQQAQATADQATQQLQQTQQQMGAQLQQSQTESMAANEELMRLRQGIQDYRQQLQQLALSDPTTPPAPPQVDPATGQPMDPAAAEAQGQAAPGQEQAPPQAQPGQEAMPKQSEAVPPMLAPGAEEMPPGMPPEMGEGEEEEMGLQDIESDLTTMSDDELMELLDAVQGELEARDQEDVEANDAEHQNAMGLAEGAVAASKTKTAGKAKKVEQGFEHLIGQVRKMRQDARQLRRLNREAGHGPLKELGKGVLLAGAGGAAGGTIGYMAGREKGREDAFKGASVRFPFVKAADAIPNRRYGIETDHGPGALEKNSDWGQRAAGAAIGGLAAAGIQGLSDRKGASGKSDKEVVLAHKLKELEKQKDKGVVDKYKTVMYRAMHDTSKINREHPRTAAVLAGLTGATAGAIATPSIVKGVKGLLKHVSGK